MSPVEYHMPESVPKGVIVYQDGALEHLWSKLQHAQPNVEQTNSVLNEICDLLLQHVRAHLGSATFLHATTPIYVLRGGLFFLSAFQRAGMHTVYGLIVPYRSTLASRPMVIYADLPVGRSDGVYLLMDLIVNTGATIIESLQTVCSALGRTGSKGEGIHVMSPFMTAKAINRILGEFPCAVLHTFWNNMVIGEDGRLLGLNFDGGDYACGGGQRVHFLCELALRSLLSRGRCMAASIYKVGAIIVKDGRILVVKKDVPGRNEYILPGGKVEGSEKPLETLRRELQEELDVELVDAQWFGRFQEVATFEDVPILMDVYIVNIKGDPSPHSEIQDYLWIDRTYRQCGILLGNVLERQMMPELLKRNII